jgi:hypothetical protein
VPAVRRVVILSLAGSEIKMSTNLRIFLRDRTPIKAISKILKPGDGEIWFTVFEAMHDLNVLDEDRFETSSLIAAEIKSIPGVIDVEEYETGEFERQLDQLARQLGAPPIDEHCIGQRPNAFVTRDPAQRARRKQYVDFDTPGRNAN